MGSWTATSGHSDGSGTTQVESARTRDGRFGGDFEGRTRLLRQMVEGMRRDAPGLDLAIYGVVLIVVVWLAPGGLIGLLSRVRPNKRRVARG